MFSRSIDTLEQREALIDLFDRHFESGPRTRANAGIDGVPPHRRTRRQIVLVRGNRIARRA
jgi:hypothetical protein